MSKKAKPKLHLVRGELDRELYSPEIDWFYGCYDSICGLASIGGDVELVNVEGMQIVSGQVVQIGIVGGPCYRESNWYTDAHVTFRSGPRYPGAFTKARRIWAALQAIPYQSRLTLKRLYEPRQWFPPGYAAPTEQETRAAHKAYNEAREAARQAEREAA